MKHRYPDKDIKTEVSSGFREKRRDNLLIDCAVSGV